MCYVSFTFFSPCFSAHVLSDAIVNSLAFHRSVLTPQLLLYYVLIMSLHFCTLYTLTARTLTNLVLVAKDFPRPLEVVVPDAIFRTLGLYWNVVTCLYTYTNTCKGTALACLVCITFATKSQCQKVCQYLTKPPIYLPSNFSYLQNKFYH